MDTSEAIIDRVQTLLIDKLARANETLATMRVLLAVPMESGLTIRAMKAALDLHDRPFAVEEECPACGQVAELSDTPNGSLTFAAPVCYDCRNPDRQPQSQAERDGDA